MTRSLNDAEQQLLEFLLEDEFPGREALVAQASTVGTAGSSCDCGCPSFSLIADRSLLPADTENPATEAHGRDPGGNRVGVLLFVRDGYLAEIEVFNWTDSKFAGLPRPEALRHSKWTEPDENGVRRLLNED